MTPGRLPERSQPGCKEKVAGLGRTGAVAGRLVGLAAWAGGWPGRTSGRLPTLARHPAHCVSHPARSLRGNEPGSPAVYLYCFSTVTRCDTGVTRL